jgi:hypothetical protein
MNRRILAIPLGIALVAIIGASLAPLFVTPPVTRCAYLSTPVRFLKIDSRPVQVGRGTRQFIGQFPVVEYSYVVSGKSYTSTQMFCRDSESFKVDWSKVDRFFHDAEVVAWFAPSLPESACISIDAEFDYSLVSHT